MGNNNHKSISFFTVCLIETSLRRGALVHFSPLRESASILELWIY